VKLHSFEGPLVPAEFLARTRAKYVPTPTAGAKNVVAVLPVPKLAKLLAPVEDPASMTYVVGMPPVLGAFQDKETLKPLTPARKLDGVPGASMLNPTVIAISSEVADPDELIAVTRKKYRPLGSAPLTNVRRPRS
jgi:hypothetical protein